MNEELQQKARMYNRDKNTDCNAKTRVYQERTNVG